MPSCRCVGTCPGQRSHAFITCTECFLSVGNLAVMSLPDWCLRLSCCRWIIVTLYSPAFQPRHWLPIDKRIDYKLCLLVHKASTYIADILTLVSSDQSLSTQRSATNGDYIVPCTHRKLGEWAFLVAAPKTWNQLPTNLKTSTCSTGSFKRSLKIFLFHSAYGCEARVS